jgi:hypothetical protein
LGQIGKNPPVTLLQAHGLVNDEKTWRPVSIDLR